MSAVAPFITDLPGRRKVWLDRRRLFARELRGAILSECLHRAYRRSSASAGAALLASVLDRRQERAERRREHIAELNKRAVETDLRLKRLYDAIETGIADLDDPALKERITSLKAIREQMQADAARAATMLESSAHQAITPQMVQKLATTARERIRIDGGGYRRDHLRALAQRVEVADREVRIIGSKSNLLQTLTAASGVKSATPGVRSSVLKWRRGREPISIDIACSFRQIDIPNQRRNPRSR